MLRLLDSGDDGDGEAALWLRRLWTTPDGRDLVAVDSRQRVFGGRLRRLIELREELPRTAVGKLSKTELRQELRERHPRGGA